MREPARPLPPYRGWRAQGATPFFRVPGMPAARRRRKPSIGTAPAASRESPAPSGRSGTPRGRRGRRRAKSARARSSRTRARAGTPHLRRRPSRRLRDGGPERPHPSRNRRLSGSGGPARHGRTKLRAGAVMGGARASGPRSSRVSGRRRLKPAAVKEGRSLHTEAAAAGLGRLPAVHCRSTVAGRPAHPCGARPCHRQRGRVAREARHPCHDQGPGRALPHEREPEPVHAATRRCLSCKRLKRNVAHSP